MSSVNSKWLTASQHLPYALRQRVKNDSGADIAKYDLVVAANVAPEGNYLKVAAADNADAALDTAGTRMMVAIQKIANGKRGDVVPWIMLTGQNTNSYAAAGSPVYMTTSGDITHTKPATNNFVRIVGRVIVKSATVGVLMLDPNGETGAGASLIRTGQATVANGATTVTYDLGAQFAGAFAVATVAVTAGSTLYVKKASVHAATGVLTITVDQDPAHVAGAICSFFVDGR